MNNRLLVASCATIFSINLFSAEPSAFGAGDLDNPEPYGLSKSEKIVLENKNEIKDVLNRTKKQTYQIDSLRERVDGIQSIVENLTRNSHQNKIDLGHLEDKIVQDLNNSNEYEKRVSKILEENVKKIDDISLKLEHLSELVNNIELTFITKDEFNGLVSDFNNFKKILKSELKTKDVKKVSQKKNRTNWEISKDAEANFEKKHYTDAIRDYEYLIKQNFKPAYSHYMIGEMKFRRKDYAEAIAYFKKSAELYSKAKYMPSLMLHTAMAMEATGDIKNAKAFYNAIASSYPDTKEATVALKNLESMK
jgi:TolA-binding protein